MKGKSPMMKALIGKQGNLPQQLQAKILASPATMKKESPAMMYKESSMKMKKESMAKMKKESSMKMMKNSPAKKAVGNNPRDTIKKILEPGIVKLNRVLKGGNKNETFVHSTQNAPKGSKIKGDGKLIKKDTKSKINLAPKSNKDKKFDENKGSGKNMIVKKPKAKKKVSFAEAYKKRDMKTYGNLSQSEYTKEAKRQIANKKATTVSPKEIGVGGKMSKGSKGSYDAPKSQMKGSVLGPKTKGGDATNQKAVKTITKTTPKVDVKKATVTEKKTIGPKNRVSVKSAKASKKASVKNAKQKSYETRKDKRAAISDARKSGKASIKEARKDKRDAKQAAKQIKKSVRKESRADVKKARLSNKRENLQNKEDKKSNKTIKKAVKKTNKLVKKTARKTEKLVKKGVRRGTRAAKKFIKEFNKENA